MKNNSKSTTDEARNGKRDMLEMMCESINADAKKMCATRHMILLSATPRETALFRKQVNAHSDRIADLSLLFGCSVFTNGNNARGNLPEPELINITQTLLNFDNNR